MAKRERTPVSRDTELEVIRYLHRHWPAKFPFTDSIFRGRPMQALKPISKGPWAVTVGGKRLPLMRVKTDKPQLVIEPCGQKAWRIGVVRLATTFGIRMSRRRRGRWTDVTNEQQFSDFMHRFLDHHPYGFGDGNEQTLFFDEVEADGEIVQIKYCVRHRAGKGVFDADSTTVQRWLVNEHGCEADTRTMDGLSNLLSRLAEIERPTETRVTFLTGTDLLGAYAREEAAHSCMTGRHNTKKVELYSLNPDQCAIALAYSDTHKECATARCIVWIREENGKQVWYIDRVYPPHTKYLNLMRSAINFHAEYVDEDVEVRWFREEEYIRELDDDGYELDEYFDEDDPHRQAYVNSLPATMNPVFRLKLPPHLTMPYMDTLIWGQQLSDGTGLFARTPSLLIPFKQDADSVPNRCPIKLENGVHAISHAEEMMCTEGGYWQVVMGTCNHCRTEYNTRPAGMQDENHGYWQTQACPNCYDELYVLPYEHKGRYGSVAYFENPILKEDADWSKNLNAWVNPNSNTAYEYLVYDEEEDDWFDKNDERVQKKICGHRKREISRVARVVGVPDFESSSTPLDGDGDSHRLPWAGLAASDADNADNADNEVRRILVICDETVHANLNEHDMRRLEQVIRENEDAGVLSYANINITAVPEEPNDLVIVSVPIQFPTRTGPRHRMWVRRSLRAKIADYLREWLYFHRVNQNLCRSFNDGNMQVREFVDYSSIMGSNRPRMSDHELTMDELRFAEEQEWI